MVKNKNRENEHLLRELAESQAKEIVIENKHKHPRFYSVTKGETFTDIEKKFGLEKGSLKKLNPNIDLANVPNGKMIQIEG